MAACSASTMTQKLVCVPPQAPLQDNELHISTQAVDVIRGGAAQGNALVLIALPVYGAQTSTRNSRRTRIISTGGKIYRYSYQPTSQPTLSLALLRGHAPIEQGDLFLNLNPVFTRATVYKGFQPDLSRCVCRSVVEHPLRMREVQGSNPCSSTRCTNATSCGGSYLVQPYAFSVCLGRRLTQTTRCRGAAPSIPGQL